MAHQLFDRIGFVMDGEPIHHGGARFIQPNDVDFRSLATKLDDNFIQGADRRDIPKNLHDSRRCAPFRSLP